MLLHYGRRQVIYVARLRLHVSQVLLNYFAIEALRGDDHFSRLCFIVERAGRQRPH